MSDNVLDKFDLYNWIYDNCFEYGDFRLKSGAKSNFYVDLRKAYSSPKVLKSISHYLGLLIQDFKPNTQTKLIGVPYGGIPYASCVSLMYDMSMLMIRKEAKNYGKKQLVEGSYKKGDSVILIEDTVTTGSSIIETIKLLLSQGLNVEGVVTIMNRGNLEKLGKQLKIKVNSLFHIDDFKKDKNKIYRRLVNLKETKKTNLIFSADIEDEEAMLDAVKLSAKKIACIKVHSDIYDNPKETLKKLWRMSQKYDFLVYQKNFRFHLLYLRNLNPKHRQ